MAKVRDYACNGDIVELHTYTVGTTPVQIAQGRPARRALIITASGNEAITVGLNSSVVVGSGLTFLQTVDPVEFDRQQLAPFVVSALWAVAAAPAGTITVLEIVDNPYLT